MIRRTIAAAVLLLGALALVGPATPAAAGGGSSDYAGCDLFVLPPQFEADQTVLVVGVGFQPSFLTTIFFDDVTQLRQITTTAQGWFITTVRIPADADDGPHTITALCDEAGNISSTDVIVSSSAVAPPAAPLPRTGSDSTEPLVVAGVLALLAGVGFVVVARRRRKTHVGV